MYPKHNCDIPLWLNLQRKTLSAKRSVYVKLKPEAATRPRDEKSRLHGRST